MKSTAESQEGVVAAQRSVCVPGTRGRQSHTGVYLDFTFTEAHGSLIVRARFGGTSQLLDGKQRTVR